MSRFVEATGHRRCEAPGGSAGAPVMKVPLSGLSQAALTGIIEAFVLREGTDYGHADHDLAAKCRAVRRQLESGEAEITFDPATGSVDIRPCERTRARPSESGHQT